MKNIFVVVIIMIIMVGCNTKEETAKGVNMSLDQEKAYELMQNEEVIIIDVRTIEEYGEGHLKDSNLLPLDMVESEVENMFPDKSALYLVYCRSGNRSGQAISIMAELGYTKAYNIGGINTWPYEIVNE